MIAKYNPGDTAFLVENRCFIREAKNLADKGRIGSLRFIDVEGGIKVHESRLFPPRQASNDAIKRKSAHWLNNKTSQCFVFPPPVGHWFEQNCP